MITYGVPGIELLTMNDYDYQINISALQNIHFLKTRFLKSRKRVSLFEVVIVLFPAEHCTWSSLPNQCFAKKREVS